MGRLDGKVAIITGAAGGMGLAGAQLFCKEGAKVVATDIDFDLVKKEVEKIVSNGGDAIALRLDVTKPESWQEVVNKTIDTYGKIDILVNNAGIHMAKGILEAEVEDWNKVFAINSTGPFLGMKYVIPHMVKNGGGSIINTSSTSAMLGGRGDGNAAAYCASKGAVRSLTKHAAIWWGPHNIRVNSVHPGPCFTPLAEKSGVKSREEMGAYNQDCIALKPACCLPIDIANAYLYLASDESSFVTGLELLVDGGWVCHS